MFTNIACSQLISFLIFTSSHLVELADDSISLRRRKSSSGSNLTERPVLTPGITSSARGAPLSSPPNVGLTRRSWT